ncbi:hypothetical protein AVEN_59874-1 [Araneus ventricosus]|uniref:Uncharacterized protein n=1 Tax=Araneus ventricosus TaxID=182803 RepID=A0A4Y2GUE3_ARAVE|nr:hypothetical protein AVEN_59874-1 [Araneus ventricosus]
MFEYFRNRKAQFKRRPGNKSFSLKHLKDNRRNWGPDSRLKENNTKESDKVLQLATTKNINNQSEETRKVEKYFSSKFAGMKKRAEFSARLWCLIKSLVPPLPLISKENFTNSPRKGRKLEF